MKSCAGGVCLRKAETLPAGAEGLVSGGVEEPVLKGLVWVVGEGNCAHQQCLQGIVCATWSCAKSSLWLMPAAGKEQADAFQILLPVYTAGSSPEALSTGSHSDLK